MLGPKVGEDMIIIIIIIISNGNCSGDVKLLRLDLIYYYEPIISTVYALYTVRRALIRKTRIDEALKSGVITSHFDHTLDSPPSKPIQIGASQRMTTLQQ